MSLSELDNHPLVYITRGVLQNACSIALEWITSFPQEQKLMELAKRHTRGRGALTMRKYLPYKLLVPGNITWCSNLVDFHWAETDGITIELNNVKPWTFKELVNTLVHEVLHGYVIVGGHEIPEEKEHKIMFGLHPGLVVSD